MPWIHFILGSDRTRVKNRRPTHYGSHAWPAMASAIITVVEDDRVKPVLSRLHELDESKPKLGLRAFVWNIEDSI